MPYELMGLEDELLGYGMDELLGEDDYLEGDDDLMGDYELMGARRRRGRRRLVRKGYGSARALLLGFDPIAMAIGATNDFTANPQVPFRPRRIIIGATSIVGLVVEDIKIGKNSQLVNAGAFPAIGFAGDTTEQLIKFDTAVPGIDIVITMTNTSGAANTVSAGMFGAAATR